MLERRGKEGTVRGEKGEQYSVLGDPAGAVLGVRRWCKAVLCVRRCLVICFLTMLGLK